MACNDVGAGSCVSHVTRFVWSGDQPVLDSVSRL